jgi:hypothetical protein
MTGNQTTPAGEASSGEPLFARVDVSAWIGPYPFRDVPHPDPEVLVRVLARERVQRAWVGWLPSAWQRDPAPGNDRLHEALAPYRSVLEPAPAVRPDWPRWERELARQVAAGATSIRAYPAQWGYGPGHPGLTALAHACREASLPLHLTMRVEDLRQRHPHDVAGDVPAATVRSLARSGSGCALVVSGASRDSIEEIYWGLTPAEQALVWFDFGWVWGPPEDHFAHLWQTVGETRFVLGTQWPLRLVQQSRALLDLLPPHVQRPKLLGIPSAHVETSGAPE